MGVSKAERRSFGDQNMQGKEIKEDVQANVNKGCIVSMTREGETFFFTNWKYAKQIYALLFNFARRKMQTYSISPIFHFIFHDAKIWVHI
jgi:hypothetical protein